MALSDDLRERVVEAVVLGGVSRNQAAAHFKVSVASAVRWVKRFTTTGEISPAPSGGDRRSGRIESHRDYKAKVCRRMQIGQHATNRPFREIGESKRKRIATEGPLADHPILLVLR